MNMKKRITAFVLSLAFLFLAYPVYAAGAQDTIDSVGETRPIRSVTVSFDANGGSGSMNSMTVTDATPVQLTKNTFTRKGFTFCGWNTQADGSGTDYADQAYARPLAENAAYGQTITLYARWKINPPKIKKLTPTVPGALKISYSKVAQAGGYEIQYSASKKFKKADTVVVKKGTSGAEITDFIPGKTYYVRIRSYDSKTKTYGDWSSAKQKKTKKGSTLANTKAATGIEADVTLSGTGSGYHAKLVLVTPLSAVSYGIQYDVAAAAPYTGKAMAMIENVASNAAGGQQYTRPGNRELKTGRKYHMMITIDIKGKGNVYLDYKKIGSFSNPRLANQAVYPRVEAAVRLNGDSVKATFDNIKLTRGGVVQKGIFADGQIFRSNKGIKTKRTKNKNKVVISGKGTGINGDWDSDYENVSGIYQF